MKLNIQQRLTLLSILPVQNNFLTMKVVKNLKNDLLFTEEEIKEFEMDEKTVGDKIYTTWNKEKSQEKEISIGEKAIDVITKQLKKLDTEEKLDNNTYELYELFKIE